MDRALHLSMMDVQNPEPVKIASLAVFNNPELCIDTIVAFIKFATEQDVAENKMTGLKQLSPVHLEAIDLLTKATIHTIQKTTYGQEFTLILKGTVDDKHNRAT